MSSVLISSRASAAPRQKCRPPAPNAWWSGRRVTSRRWGSVVDGLVAVRRHVPEQDLVALADRLAVKLDVAGGGAAEVGEGRVHPQELLDRAFDQSRVVAQ